MEHTNLKMAWIRHQIKQKDGFLMYPPPLSASSSSPYTDAFHGQPPPSSPSPSPSGTRISPAVLFIIVILAVLFFISGLLHLLVRFLVKQPSSAESSQSDRYPENSSSDTLQRQLQQLFHLHDSGLDQAFIDALPVFQYKEIVGPTEPFDCAVCLCEFSEKDKLRLLPMCSHAFHVGCIDTWLLSNSSCPLCRGTLFTPGFPIENPIFDFDDLREEDGYPGNGENRFASGQKRVEIEEIVVDKGVLPVRLGKFRRLNDEVVEAGGETSSSNLDARRCFSMGSYQYVVGNSDLRVTLSHNQRERNVKLETGIEQNGNPPVEGDVEGKKISSVAKGESFSVSKIWQWSKKGKFSSPSEVPMCMPSSLTVDLPWMKKTEER
ncbi:RING-H2 finger protein ATL46-like [Tripterygium wilfordii]|uniref:RING-type E3 ubiquitin transferase n=1 Tax=Tripterygium wilfordii TaxID=458696 RepID=A0A7J7D1W4_TRIWF|nr:RING-H2 finger protein ATL46 [Tripterygium wilfordii]XP_038716006.1 RING-H2 finger protein ATL46 [Tripterygium wilfordii]KAF5740355.1 RING-H2 finger protein ATL46-like [Tripterygium wilfordii]